MKLLVTGGSGFIGSNFIRHVLAEHPDDRVVNLDKLTYAGNPANLADLERDPRYAFVHGDICDAKLVRDVTRGVDAIVNFAAEIARRSLAHRARRVPQDRRLRRVHAAGGGAGAEDPAVPAHQHRRGVRLGRAGLVARERSAAAVQPVLGGQGRRRPARAGLLAHAPASRSLITRSSNNFGPYQYPEKVIPLFVTNALDDRPLPLYGDGRNVRDWLYVLDNCAAIDLVLRRGGDGEVYNIGGGHEVENVVLTREILRLTGKPETLIQPVTDRPGHDRRYSLDSHKVRQLGWTPRHRFADALERHGALVPRARGVVAAAQVGRVPRVLRTAVRPPLSQAPRRLHEARRDR